MFLCSALRLCLLWIRAIIFFKKQCLPLWRASVLAPRRSPQEVPLVEAEEGVPPPQDQPTTWTHLFRVSGYHTDAHRQTKEASDGDSERRSVMFPPNIQNQSGSRAPHPGVGGYQRVWSSRGSSVRRERVWFTDEGVVPFVIEARVDEPAVHSPRTVSWKKQHRGFY